MWGIDSASGTSNASSTTVAFPRLTPNQASELYFGYAAVANTGADGATPGFSYATTSDADVTAFNSNVSSTVQPTAKQSPAGFSGAVAVLITASSGSSSGAPKVSSVSPNSGPTTGNMVVQLTGTGFTGTTLVSFGSTATTNFTINSDTALSVYDPAGSVGTVDVTVNGPGGTSATSSADQFTYAGPPTVTSVTPASGPITGGNSVTIAGTDFTSVTGVAFGPTVATSFTVSNSTSITAEAPAAPQGTVDVTVSTSGGTSAESSADQYSYTTPAASITQQVLGILAPAGGVHGVFLQQLGGPVLASANADYPFEPASSIKSVIALYAMTRVVNGTAHLTDLVPVVPGTSPDDCPTPSTSGTETLDNAIQQMMQVSDNNRALELMLYFGVDNLNGFATSLGLTHTNFQTSAVYPGFNILGCPSYPLLSPTVDGNTASLADLSKVWSAANELPHPYSDEYFQLTAGREMANTQGSDYSTVWPSLVSIAENVAPSYLGTKLQTFIDHMTVSVKGGNYFQYTCTTGSSCEATWWSFAGIAQIPSCAGRRLTTTTYTWGYFIDDAVGPYDSDLSQTTASQAFAAANGQLLYQPIKAALNSWAACAPRLHPTISSSGRRVRSGPNLDIGQVLATVTDSDLSDIPADLTGTIDWGDGSPASFDTVVGGNGVFSVHGSHTYPAPGTYAVTVTVGPAYTGVPPTVAHTTVTVS